MGEAIHTGMVLFYNYGIVYVLLTCVVEKGRRVCYALCILVYNHFIFHMSELTPEQESFKARVEAFMEAVRPASAEHKIDFLRRS